LKLIVGLGNPGAAYQATRHNAGWWICDILAKRAGVDFSSKSKFGGLFAQARMAGDRIALLKPTTFMNRSGQSVGAVLRFFDGAPEDLLVIHDDVDLEAGRIKMKLGGGSGGHKGLKSIVETLGNDEFYRLRFGVGRSENPMVETSNFVLARISGELMTHFAKAADEAADAAVFFIENGLTETQNRFHDSRGFEN